MTDKYCWECTEYIFAQGPENSFRGLCGDKECVAVTCSHCGFILVDALGLNVRGGYSGESYVKTS